MLMFNAHDGSKAFTLMNVATRVVCNNTLNIAIREKGGKGIKIRHSGVLGKKVRDAQEALGIATEEFAITAQVFSDLARYQIRDAQIQEVLEKLFPKTETNRSEFQKERVLNLMDNGVGTEIAGVRGTAWGFYNALTELEDHVNGAGAKGQYVADSRFRRVLMGSGMDRKADALEAILEVVGR